MPKTQDPEPVTVDVEWPARPSELTVEHIPQKLLDEIRRPERDRAHRLGLAVLGLNESRNELVGELNRLMRLIQRDSQRLDAAVLGPDVHHALRELGLIKDGD